MAPDGDPGIDVDPSDAHDTFDINESNVLDRIEDVAVVEERYKEGSHLVLTREQVVIELTNLLYEIYKGDVQRRVETYQGLLNKGPVPHSPTNGSFSILPTARINKVLYYEDPEFNVDPEYEKENEVTFVRFHTFLNQRHQLAKSRESYISTMARLDRLMAPFVSKGGAAAPRDTDVLRILGSTLSLTPHRILQGEDIDGVGYAVLAQGAKEVNTFDWNAYLAEVRDLTEGDHVEIYHNDFVFDSQGRVVYKTKGRVKRVADGAIHISTGGEEVIYTIEDPPTTMFVYPANTGLHRYSKVQLAGSVHFLNFSQGDISRYILPATFTELLFVLLPHTGVPVASFTDINAITCSHGYNINDLPSACEPILRRLMAKRYPALKISRPAARQYVSPNHYRGLLAFSNPIVDTIRSGFADIDIYRYKILHSSPESETVRLCTLLKEWRQRANQALDIRGLQERKRRLAGLINSFSAPKDECSGSGDAKGYRITKVYGSLHDLRRDDGRHVYYDPDLDPTDYKARAKHDGEERRIRDEVAKQPGVDVEFEVHSVMAGRRRVRPGEHCLLSTSDGEEVYARRTIDGEEMWIKVARLPFRVCKEDLSSASELAGDTACVFDTYDNICRTAKAVRENIAYNRNKALLDAIEGELAFHDNFDSHTETIDVDVRTAKAVRGLLQHREQHVHIAEDLLPSLDIEEFDGDIQEEGLQLQFQDQDRYEVMYVDQDQARRPEEPSGPSHEFLAMVCGFMDLSISPEDARAISDRVEATLVSGNTSTNEIREKIRKERVRLERGINQALYAANEEYRKKADKLIADKLGALESKMVADMYYDVATKIIALLSLTIMAKYPDVVIKSVYPSCVRFLTYMGYPLNEKNATRSISKYMCCLTKGITAGEDPRYQKVQDTTIERFNDDVISYLDDVLREDINMRLRVEANKALISTKRVRADTRSPREFYGFRPTFDFADRISNRVALLLKEMDSAVRTSRHLKVSMASTPTLANSCCLEPLGDGLTYYTFFEGQGAFKDAARAVRSKLSRPSRAAPTVAKYFAPQKVPQGLVTRQGSIQFSSTGRVPERYSPPKASNNQEALLSFIGANGALLGPMPKADWDDQSFWDETLFKNAISIFESMKSIISRVDDGYDEMRMDMFRALVAVRGLTNDHSTVATALRGYVTCTLPRILSRIVNQKRRGEDKAELSKLGEEADLYVAFLNATAPGLLATLDSTTPRAGHHLRFSKKDEDPDIVDIKAISLCTFVVMKVAYAALTYTITGSVEHDVDEASILRGLVGANDNKLDQVSLSCRLATHIIGGALSAIAANDLNIADVRGRVEELREKKKQELMALYRVDDEERQLQMALKKLGMDTWYDVGAADEEKDVYVDMLEKPKPVADEDANYRMDNPGDNADDDELDEDYPPQFIFSAERE